MVCKIRADRWADLHQPVKLASSKREENSRCHEGSGNHLGGYSAPMQHDLAVVALFLRKTSGDQFLDVPSPPVAQRTKNGREEQARHDVENAGHGALPSREPDGRPGWLPGAASGSEGL